MIYSSIPRAGLDGIAISRRGIRPARKASRPASTANPIARAIATGSAASASAVFIRMPSTPCSMVRHASEAVPTPASTMTGTAETALDRTDAERIDEAEPAPDRGREGHHRGAAGLLQPEGRDQVVVGVGQHLKALADQDARRRQQAVGVGQQRLAVADDLQLDELVESRLARQPGVAHRFVGGVTAGGVGEEEVLVGAQVMEDALFLAAVEIHPAHGHRHDLRARSGDRAHHVAVVAVFAGADHETRAEAASADRQRGVGEGVGGTVSGVSVPVMMAPERELRLAVIPSQARDLAGPIRGACVRRTVDEDPSLRSG